MNTAGRLAAFGAGLAAAVGLGAGIGATIGPAATGTGSGSGAEVSEPAPVGEGVVSATNGYRMVPHASAVAPAGGPYRFVVTSPGGGPQLRFTPVHQRDLHLIVVNRELTVYHHLHPTLGTGGTWSTDLPALPAGSYRAVADFRVTGGPRLAIGVDLAVAGSYRPGRLAEPSTRAMVDGYVVRLATTRRGTSGEVTAALAVHKDGRLVTDLQPYLGAGGHLVAMRAGDLAYAHVHPTAAGPGGPGAVRFDATLTAAGRYALFFDFKHAGTVRTAAFTYDQGVVGGAAEMEH